MAFFKYLHVVTHKHPINSDTQETRCGPGVKIDFLWVQEGDGRLQPRLVAVTVFVHSGLPAQPSGFRVRFEKTTSESAVEELQTRFCYRVGTTNKAQPGVSEKPRHKPPQSATQLQDLRELLQMCCNFNVPLRSVDGSFSMLPSTTGNYSNAHKSKIFSGLLSC